MYGGYRQPLWLVIGVVVLAVVAVVLTVVALTSTPTAETSSHSRLKPVPQPEPEAETDLPPAPLRPVRALFQSGEPLTVSVLGDGTSDEDDEWVALWVQDLADTRTVTLHMWDERVSDFADPVTYGDGGQSVDVWNFSVSGATPDAPAGRLPAAQPEQPDLVVYNFGHTSTPGDVGAQLDATVRAVRRQWEGDRVRSLLILQNPSRREDRIEQAETVFNLRSYWSRVSRVPIANVFAAFRYAPGPVGSLMEGDAQPNDRGSRLWARVIAAALRPR
jgi:hypothetical protein